MHRVHENPLDALHEERNEHPLESANWIHDVTPRGRNILGGREGIGDRMASHYEADREDILVMDDVYRSVLGDVGHSEVAEEKSHSETVVRSESLRIAHMARLLRVDFG